MSMNANLVAYSHTPNVILVIHLQIIHIVMVQVVLCSASLYDNLPETIERSMSAKQLSTQTSKVTYWPKLLPSCEEMR